MSTAFQAAYKHLNAAQREAVDAIEGPVLVVAGPGTGKTQLLSLRVANILQKTDTDPGNILCLTFTNFAATNMRERLASLVGPAAHNVMVRTFHSFAAEIMNLYPAYFWNGARLGIAPDAVQLDIMQDILAKLPLDNPLALKFAGAYTMIGDVQQALKLTKEAGLTPEKLAAMLAVNEAYLDVIEPQLIAALSPILSMKKLTQLQIAVDALPDQPIDSGVAPLSSLSTVLKESLALAIANDQKSGKTTQTGKWKRRWLQTVSGEKAMFDERRRNAWWQAMVPVYNTYRDTLHARGYYDYSDMLVEVITQLEQRPELLASVQEHFLYTLIDEFQDTNAAQLRLAHLVATNAATGDQPNLLAVGDDDQSIFAFNGAELNNMLAFRRTYTATKLIVLTENYRSSQDLLDAAETIIEQAEDRLVTRETDLSKHLQAAADPGKGTIIHVAYPTREHQLSAIAHQVQAAWQQSDQQSIAVLARSHQSLRELSALLAGLQVPIRYEQQNNVLDQPVVAQLCLLAEIVTAISQGDIAVVNFRLAQLLQHPVWRIDAATLWQLATTNYARPNWLNSLLQHSDEHLKGLGNWLLWLGQQTAHEPLGAMLEYLLGLRAGTHLTSPLRDYFLTLGGRKIDTTYLEGLSGLRRLRSATEEFVALRPETTHLTDFVHFIRLHQDLAKPITDESWFISGEQAVQLMTVHKAKGLEFDTVFVLDAVEANWQPRHMGRKPPANLPLQPYGEHYDDYVRLLYVAATRAKRSLFISSYYTDEQGRVTLATPLTSELPTRKINADQAEAPIPILEQGLRWPRLTSNDERLALSSKLADYQLSATGLLQFLDVTTGGPQHFLERQLLHLPEQTTATMAYGTAIHKALQTAQLLTNSGAFSLENVLQSYEHSLEQQQLPEDETTRYRTHGKQTLTSLFQHKGFQLISGDQAELSLADVRLGEARLAGKLDHVAEHDNTLLITDYKTGKALTSFTTRDQTKAVKAWRHRTQLLFYLALARHSGRFQASKHMTARMLYVETEHASELALALAADENTAARLEQLTAAVWQHIIDLNFPLTSNYSPNIQGIIAFEDDLLSGRG